MSMRKRIGASLPQVFLRLALGVTFLHAGLGKLIGTAEVGPEDAAILGNLGVIPAVRQGAGLDLTPAPSRPLPAPDRASAADVGFAVITVSQDGGQPGVQPENPPAPAPPSAQPPAPADKPAPTEKPAPSTTPPPAVLPGGAAVPKALTAQDFPQGAKVERVHQLAVSIYKAANPPPKEDGTPGMPLWPPSLAKGSWPVYLADAVMITEIAGGAMLLIGLLVRLWSMMLAGVMAGAIWLTQVGPAVQSGKTVLGVLPDHARWDTLAWMPLFWMFALLMAALALMFAGSGTLALDNVVFGTRRAEDHDGE